MICVHFLCQVPLLVLLSIHSIHRGIQDVHSDQHVDKGDQLQNWRLLHVFHSTHSVHRCMGIQHIQDRGIHIQDRGIQRIRSEVHSCIHEWEKRSWSSSKRGR